MVGVTIITFVLTNLVPASPVTAALGDRAADDPKVVAAFKAANGLDKPLVVQYFVYLGHLLQGNLGTSIRRTTRSRRTSASPSPRPPSSRCSSIVCRSCSASGWRSSRRIRHNRLSDQIIRVVSLVGISIPTFWLAVAAYFLFFFVLQGGPGLGPPRSRRHAAADA